MCVCLCLSQCAQAFSYTNTHPDVLLKDRTTIKHTLHTYLTHITIIKRQWPIIGCTSHHHNPPTAPHPCVYFPELPAVSQLHAELKTLRASMMQVITELPAMCFVLRNLDWILTLAGCYGCGWFSLRVLSAIQNTSHLNPVLSASSLLYFSEFFLQLLKKKQRLSVPNSSVDSLKLLLLTAAIQLIMCLSDRIVASVKIHLFIKMSV